MDGIPPPLASGALGFEWRLSADALHAGVEGT
jgi:hypothetical protein